GLLTVNRHMAGCRRESGTTGLICGGGGNGAHRPDVCLSRLAHFFHMSRSANIFMKTPPTTERAWNPSFFGLSVQNQSVIGTRSGVSLRKRRIGEMNASKSFFDSAMLAVQTIQSSLVYALRLSSGRPYAFCFFR